MAKILVIEDDEVVSGAITQCLSFEHFTFDTAFDGEMASTMLLSKEFDMAILDWELPIVSGIEVCKNYRASGGEMPILMLTGKSTIMEKVKGLDSGADDYLTKPFGLEELIARVRALLRRVDRKLVSDNLSFKDLILEPNNYRVTKGGKELKLIPKEFAILELLLRYQGKVFTPESIIDRVWKQSDYPALDVVRTHVMNLRRKLGDDVIETVHGVGYKLSATK